MASKVLVPLGDGFEEIEAIAVIDILRRAGVEVVVAATSETVRVVGGRQVVVEADALLSAVSMKAFDAIVVPGGPGTKALREHAGLRAMLQEAAADGKLVAAICAAPTVLVKAGLLQGRRAACYPSSESDMTGATIVREPVVVDGQFVTSRGAGTAIHFALKLVEILVGAAEARDIADKIVFAPV